MVRLRQLVDQIRHRLLFVPLAFVAGAILLSQVTLQADQRLDGDGLPRVLQTTVGSGRAILSAIAGGLISSVTLLLSLMLVAVQLASSQFSPRTTRDWIGDRTQQITIGIVLGTTVYCLLILRETREFAEGDGFIQLTPHLSVLLALLLGVLSLIGVVRSVDHLTNSLRIGSVAGKIMDETVALIEVDERLASVENPSIVPAAMPAKSELDANPPPDAFPVTAPEAGWVQQIDEDAIIGATPKGSTAIISVALGSFTLPNAPMVWVSPPPAGDECAAAIQAAIALGDARTMQQDIGYGILRMVDIALRALSPGVNDPNTANDIVVHLGVVMLAMWERPFAPSRKEVDGRTIVRHDLEHSDYLHAGFDQIRRYGASDPEVAATMIRVLVALRGEAERRGLPGPLEPIDEIVAQILSAVDAGDLSAYDKALVRELGPERIERFEPDPAD